VWPRAADKSADQLADGVPDSRPAVVEPAALRRRLVPVAARARGRRPGGEQAWQAQGNQIWPTSNMTRWNAAGCAASPCPPRSWSPTAAAAAPTFAGTAVTCAVALIGGPPPLGHQPAAPPPGHQPPAPPPPGHQATIHRPRQRRHQATGRPSRQRRHRRANPSPNTGPLAGPPGRAARAGHAMPQAFASAAPCPARTCSRLW